MSVRVAAAAVVLVFEDHRELQAIRCYGQPDSPCLRVAVLAGPLDTPAAFDQLRSLGWAIDEVHSYGPFKTGYRQWHCPEHQGPGLLGGVAGV